MNICLSITNNIDENIISKYMFKIKVLLVYLCILFGEHLPYIWPQYFEHKYLHIFKNNFV